MIKSSEKAGSLIESATKKMGMLAIGRFGLTTQDLLDMLHRANLEVARAHFQQDKTGFYETRIAQATTNGKYDVTGASYDASTGQLSVAMTPAAADEDVGKMITFFDGDTNVGILGKITAFTAGSPTKYTITPFFPLPSLSNVICVTVIDTLLNSDLLRLVGDNELWNADELEIYDMVNDTTIALVPPDEFRRRREMTTWTAGSTRWARFMKNNIEFDAGSAAPAIGTIKVSGYWIPPRSKTLADFVYASDSRLAEIERAFMASLYEIKTGRPMIALDSTREEKFQSQLRTTAAHDIKVD